MDTRVSVDAYEIPAVLGSFDAKDILSAAMGDTGSHKGFDPHHPW